MAIDRCVLAVLNFIINDRPRYFARDSVMTLTLDRNMRWLICFFAGLLVAVLFSFEFSAPQPAQTFSSGSVAPIVSSYWPTSSDFSFDEVAASHREPNFYQ
jgi:hypothetical protein